MNRGLGTVAVIALTLVGCGSDGREDPILLLSAEEAFEMGKDFMEQGKWLRARDHLLHAFEVEPNSATGREALLLVADSHFQAGGRDNLIKAEAKYRDFQNRFPTSARGDYVQFQIANSLAGRMRRPDRDQKATFEALDSYETLLRLYPTSPYLDEAETQMQVVRNNLAKSEYLKGYFHIRSLRLPEAAANRFERVLERYPNFDEMDKVLFYLGQSYDLLEQAEKADATWARLRTEHPNSPLVRKIPKRSAKKG